MADMNHSGPERIPPWRDIRVLGVIAQIIFLIAAIAFFAWIAFNVSQNLVTLGENQMRCRDGTTSFRCAFNFLRLDAGFDISESLIQYEPSDSYSRALLVGVLNTIRVTVLGIILATILGTITGIARLSENWLVSSIARWYIDLIRNTPLLLQLLFLSFGVIALLPSIAEASQPFGLPLFLSQRGFNLPWPVAMPSWPVWLAFIILGLIQAQVVWMMLGRQEERTGKSSNRSLWALLSFVLVAAIGWIVTGASADNHGILAARSLRIREFGDMAGVMENRLGLPSLSEFEVAREEGSLTEDEIDAAAFTVCALEETSSEVNLTAQLRSRNIPYSLSRFGRPDEATEAYAAGECEIFVADRATLAAERELLESSGSQLIVPIPETPLRLDIPRIEGLNFVGGLKLSPQFAAILIGLVVYTGAFIAEIVRAGIQAVPRGQSEAAKALGLTESQRLRLVVLPQALRVIIPPLTSQYLNLAKNSSLAIAVGYPDLFATAFTTLNQSGRPVQVFILVMGFYLSISLSISFLLNWYNARIALVER